MREKREREESGVVCPADEGGEGERAKRAGRVVQREGRRLKLYEMECRECGGRWRRWFAGRGEVGEYLRVRDVCFKGKHTVEGSLRGRVRVKRVKGE